MKHLLSISAAILVLTSCSTITFHEPQPWDKDNLSSVPETMHGTWVEERDTFNITSTGMTVSTNDELVLSISEAEAMYEFRDGLAYELDNYEDGIPYLMGEDSVVLTLHEMELYQLSDSLSIRGGDNLFVVSLGQSEEWEIILMSVSKNGRIDAYYPSVKKYTGMFKDGYIETIDHNSDVTHIESTRSISYREASRLISKKNKLFTLNPDGTLIRYRSIF